MREARHTRKQRRKKGEESGPQTLASLTMSALLDLAGPERAALVRVIAVWPSAVGERVAEAARPSRLADGILTVEVVSPVWSQQLSLLAPRLLTEVNRGLGQEMVRELRFCAARKPRG